MNYGHLNAPYYEWWLHNHPFRRAGRTCPICASDTSCFAGCPADKVKDKLDEVGELVRQYYNCLSVPDTKSVEDKYRERWEQK